METEPSDNNIDVPTTLRDYAKHRMMEDMIKSVQKAERNNNEYLIMVMDKHTRELFASICNLFEIMTKSVYHLENLELSRKEYPATPAIYFISPTQTSVNKLIEDFNDVENPHYASVHLFFSTKLADGLMEHLSSQEGLVSRIKTFCELNVDLNLYEDNIYHLDQHDSLSLFNMNLNDVSAAKYMSKIGLQIFTVCSVLNEHPYIQYQGRSKIAEKVAKSVSTQFEEFHKRMPGHNFRDPRSTLLILDRSFDMTAPFLHDYTYECLVYETVDNADQADRLCSEESKQDPHGQSEKMLDRTDLVWHKYRNLHFANVTIMINNEISRFVKENKNIDAVKKGDALEVSDLKDVLANMPKYKELLAMYSKHLNMCFKIDELVKNINMVELIRLEQMIITGLSDAGKEVSNKEIIAGIRKISDSIESSDYARLIMLYLACYEVSEKDISSLLSSVHPSYQPAVENLPYIIGKPTMNLVRRRVEVMSSDEYMDYTNKLASTDYEVLRSEPAIKKLALMAQENSLDQGIFPYIGDQPENINRFGHAKVTGQSKMKGRFAKKYGRKKNALTPQSKLLIFVIGGLSHHEIVTLNALQEDNDIDCMIIQGGNQIFQASQFMSQLKKLDKKPLKSNLDGMVVGEGSIIDHADIDPDFT